MMWSSNVVFSAKKSAHTGGGYSSEFNKTYLCVWVLNGLIFTNVDHGINVY